MRHLKALGFEGLEERKLLSRVHHLPVHAKPAVGMTPLVLTGTLTVNNQAQTTTEDDEGDVMTSTPVAGQLGALGKVRGVWNESTDEFGDYLGPDTIQLHTAKGTFVVAFNEQQNTNSAHRLPGGAMQYVRPQIAADGTGAYAGEKESGTIETTTNSGRTAIVSMTFTS